MAADADAQDDCPAAPAEHADSAALLRHLAIDTTKLGELRGAINDYADGAAEPIKISFNDLS